MTDHTSERDRFAAAALPAIIAATCANNHHPCATAPEGTRVELRIAMDAYAIADAMIEAKALSPSNGGDHGPTPMSETEEGG